MQRKPIIRALHWLISLSPPRTSDVAPCPNSCTFPSAAAPSPFRLAFYVAAPSLFPLRQAAIEPRHLHTEPQELKPSLLSLLRFLLLRHPFMSEHHVRARARRGGSESDLLPAFLFLPPSFLPTVVACPDGRGDLCAVDDLSSLSVSVPAPEVAREKRRRGLQLRRMFCAYIGDGF